VLSELYGFTTQKTVLFISGDKSALCLIKHYAMKKNGGVEVFLTSEPDGCELPASPSGPLHSEKDPKVPTLQEAGCCGEEKNHLPCREWNSGHPACSTSLYRLKYLDPYLKYGDKLKCLDGKAMMIILQEIILQYKK
jgi:hypothetical protein